MARYFVSKGTIVAAPNDSHDGRDVFGFDLSSATYTDTGHGDGNYNITSAGAFSGYSYTALDQIYISGGSITDGLYTIAQKNSDNSINLTASAGSTSSIDSSDGPWLTIQHGLDTVTAGNELVICADSTYNLTAQLDVDTQATTAISYVRLMGATARGVVNGTRATLDFSGQGAGEDGFQVDTADVEEFYVAHLNIQNCDRHGIMLDDLACFWTLENCRITGCGTNGIQLDNALASVSLYGCEIDNNTVGVNCSSATRGGMTLNCCSVHDNSSDGALYAANGTQFINSIFYLNGGSGAHRIASADDYERTNCHVVNCTFFDNTASGIDLEDATVGRTCVTGSIFRNNDVYAIDCAGDADQVMILSDNDFSGNGAVSDVTLWTGYGNLAVDPEFESETGGSEDFEPDSDSPMIGAGFSWSFSENNYPQYLDMGAIQREMAAGGGSDAVLVSQGLHTIDNGITA